ncbi:MAG TPA: hypothetical protein VF651_01500 [Gammaproteobacteria bacterium]
MMKRAALPLLLATLAGCTWVTPSPEAMQADIKVLDKTGVERCQKLAMNQLTVAHKLGTLERMPGDVEHDLRVMAMNQAAVVGADAVAPLSEIIDGSQLWGIFRCEGTAPAAATAAAPAAASGIKTLPYTPPR